MTESRHLRKREKKPRVFRAPDGYYHVKGKKYRKLRGNREEVVRGVAYQTKGELTKSELRESSNVNHAGKLVSKKKWRQSLVRSNLAQYNRSRRKA